MDRKRTAFAQNIKKPAWDMPENICMFTKMQKNRQKIRWIREKTKLSFSTKQAQQIDAVQQKVQANSDCY